MTKQAFLTRYASPLGEILLSAQGEALCGLWFAGQKYCLAALDPDTKPGMSPVLQQAKDWLDCYFAGQIPKMSLPLAPKGSEFQQAVWKKLREIPYGTTTTYGEIAKSLGYGRGYGRAVGNAVGYNPISILIPCHRVLKTDGSLSGYAGGIERKRALLQLEKDGKKFF